MFLLEHGDPDPLPALAGALQCRKDQLQATPFLEETRDDLRPLALLREAAPNQIRRPHVAPMIDGNPRLFNRASRSSLRLAIADG